MAGTAGGNHPSDGGGGGGGGGPNGSGGNYGSGDYNGVTGTDGTDVIYTNPRPTTTVSSGSYGNGYLSITYEDFFGVMFNEGEISYSPPAADAPNQLQGTITHVFYRPTVIILTSTF